MRSTTLPAACLLCSIIVAGTLVPALARAEAPAAADPLRAELVAISEEIIEAIRLGDREALSRHLAPDMILINRDGSTYTRENLIEELVPPREGYDLRFEVLEPLVIHHSESALLTFLLDEYLSIFGHDVSTVYRNHFLFHRIDGAWKLALYTYWEKPSLPPIAALDPDIARAVAGTYQLEPGKWVTHIARDGDSLTYRREGGQSRPFRRMAGDRFYIPGVEAEYFFERDAAGQVSALVFRRNWVDLRMQRVR